ncbi:MAG: bifunctional hydroxymethylpyrimidine kinase/phosphomethylpyrimidine kinase [Planctomycetes bacterium]|nr:bifunctional hydroxymethylpyrimidine kinase/phosphomethylpyrimidine kinase [Planctomycetota bacterium]
MHSTAARVLVLAAHDRAGSGLDADRQALVGLNVDARFIVTARTRLDAACLPEIGARGAGSWIPEARRELPVAVFKFGLLPTREDVMGAAYLVREARARTNAPVWAVVDPMLSARGARSLDREAALEYLRTLVPANVVLTLDLAELAQLADADVELLERDPAARVESARRLLALGAAAVIARDARSTEDSPRDLLVSPGMRDVWVEHPRIVGEKLRGSSSRYATRVAGRLALEGGLGWAARDASALVFGRPPVVARAS